MNSSVRTTASGASASTQKPLLAGYDNADILDSVNSFAASTTTVNAWTAPITPLNVSPQAPSILFTVAQSFHST
ncbi:GPI-anchored surface protein, putative [Bodo saltans]|uniref:GPI-anchored surface protein, putative n=1 Tax=Bodo saltans TaxID=75058 RepID=A0A0S4IS74_BODSA|nr:GPI-anchored surface protein, putative [Bodo saltans]CUF52656.1 GPI-anchored surface protein, putative [Bodo saltans]CUF52672.1 GPI-anchored surface protein, putative [Bodo saltans]CUF52707.1 GPI-anchored surface protein, putative [Bodo saltans]|eukprot:CUF52623.1 GPI-anchored surface protein, putative [Bodo saltans]